MKKWTTVETKHGVIVAWEDADTHFRDSVRMTYQEAWGLLHAMEELRDHPEFKVREPKKPQHELHGQENYKRVTKIITYEGDD